jgi:hypothetical protein
MATQQRTNQATRKAIRTAGWLAPLERELKSRIGWVDEAVSPFAGRSPAPEPRKIRGEPIADKAA